MKLEKIKEEMLKWRDFYGGDISDTEEMKLDEQKLEEAAEKYLEKTAPVWRKIDSDNTTKCALIEVAAGFAAAELEKQLSKDPEKLIDQLRSGFLHNNIELSSFKPGEIQFLEIAFDAGARVMFNYLKNSLPEPPKEKEL